MYFDKQKGALRNVCWSKSSFFIALACFVHPKQKKGEKAPKRGKIQQKVLTPYCWLIPKCWSTVNSWGKMSFHHFEIKSHTLTHFSCFFVIIQI